MQNQLNPTQVYIIRRLQRQGVIPFAVLRRWDQRPLRGLFMRGLFDVTKSLDAYLTRDGEAIANAINAERQRKDWNRPLFGHRQQARKAA